jgi:FkbM family methyltransferase
MSTTLRLWTVKLLRHLGVKRFRAQSGINQPFICHLGDSNGENPFYNFTSSRAEIVLMTSWCRQFEEPLVLDVGGNVGFVATQMAQLLRDRRPQIFSFEPVPFTFERLLSSVRLLELEEFVYPICSALSDAPTLARITYSERDTMFAQMSQAETSERVGNKIAWCSTLTVDQVNEAIGKQPALIKVDVEGHEVKVFEGAAKALSGEDAPGICLESNPVTLAECQTSLQELAAALEGFDLFYINDFEHQRMKFGEPIADLTDIDWVCNIFAVPQTAVGKQRWSKAVAEAATVLGSFRK